MANLSIAQYHGDTPQARVFTLNNGEQFISINFGRDTALILHGRDAEAVASARKLAHVLLDAADRIEDVLIAREKMAG